MSDTLKNQQLRDEWEPNIKFEVSEADGEVDGKHILARVKGDFFVPNGKSRNKRFYSKELWEKVLSNEQVLSRLDRRIMFGTIGHNQKLTEDALLEGKGSHIVSGLNIEGDRGIGEALILDTPAGRILNTLLRAGCKLSVSSRADGAYKGKVEDCDRVDPDRYVFETFDFVIEPGFVKARPDLVESLQALGIVESGNETETHPNEGEDEMGNATLVETLAKDNGTLKADLEKATTEIESLKTEVAGVREELVQAKNEVEAAKAAKAVSESAEATELAAYKALGSVEEVKAVIGKLDAFVESVGTLEAAEKALKLAEKRLMQYNEIGSPEKITKAMESAIATIEEYKQLGSITEIKTIFAKVEEIQTKRVVEKNEARVKELAAELKVSEDRIKTLSGKMSDDEIREFFKGLRESAEITHRFTKREAPVTESKETKPSKFQAGSLGERLMASLTRPAHSDKSE